MCSAGESCPRSGGGLPVSPREKPLAGWRLPEGKRATLARRPLPFLMLCFCGYCAYYCYCCSSSCSFLSSPVYGFPGRPPGGAGCRERSQRSCLRPDGLPSLTQNPGFAATGTVAPPLSRRGLRSWHPGKRPPGCKGQRRFANRASRRCGGSLLIACRVPHTRMSPCRRGHRQPQPSPPVQG